MTTLLTNNVALLACAPNGIQKLRSLIRRLAVMGCLTGSESEPCAVKEWRHTTFGQVFRLEYGESLPAPKRTGTGEFPVYGSNGVVGSHAECCVAAPCLVVGRKGSAGAVNVCEHHGCWVTDVAYYCVPPDEVTLRFTYLLFLTLGLDELGKGIKPGLSRNEAYVLPVSIPPLAEQHRIVAKVDELMALCDRLETRQSDAQAAHARLVDELLGSLLQARDAEDFAECWGRVKDNFDVLFTTEQSVNRLKQAVMQSAVTGKFSQSQVSQKNQGAARQEKWEIKELSQVASEIVDCPHSTPKWTPDGELCVRTSQFKPGHLDLTVCKYVSASTYDERISRLQPMAGDILYSREGGILGVACRIPPNTKLCLGQRMMLIRPGSDVFGEYLELVLNAPLITDLAKSQTTGGAAPRINVSSVKKYPIPVPPLAEQHRIVAKVDEFMALCDRVKAKIAQTQALNERLAGTLVERAVL